MGINNMILSNKWATVPDHERFVTLESQLDAARQMEADLRRELLAPNSLRLGFVPQVTRTVGLDGQPVEREEVGGTIFAGLPGDNEAIDFGHVGFSKLASLVGAPAGYLRSLPASDAARNLKVGLRLREEAGKEMRLHILPYRSPETNLRATSPTGSTSNLVTVVSPGYGFVPNAYLIEQIIRFNERSGGIWKVPAASYQARDPKRATTLYLGPGDLFDCLVAEDAFIDGAGRPIKVGFIVINSWLQTKKFEVILFTYDYICDNRTIWNYQFLKGFSKRHSLNAPEMIRREMPSLLSAYGTAVRSGEVRQRMEATIKAAQQTPALLTVKGEKVRVETPEQAAQWLTDKGYGEQLGKAAVQTWIAEDGDVPTSVFDMVQAATAGTRGMGDAETRFEKDALAGSWLGDVKVPEPAKLVVVPDRLYLNGRQLATV